MATKKPEGIYKFKGSLRRSVVQAKLLWKEALHDNISAPSDDDATAIPSFKIENCSLGELNCTIDTYQNSGDIQFEKNNPNELYAKLDSSDYWGSSLLFKTLSWIKADKDFCPSFFLGWGFCKDIKAGKNSKLLPSALKNQKVSHLSDGVYQVFSYKQTSQA